MSFGTGTRALIDQQTAILKHLRQAHAAMVEATPNLRDFRDHSAYDAAITAHEEQMTWLTALIQTVGRTRHRLGSPAVTGAPCDDRR